MRVEWKWVVPFGIGMAASSAALALPWYRFQECPAMQECRAWETRTGRQTVGLETLVALVIAAGLWLIIKDPAMRSIAVSVVLAILGAMQLFYVQHQTDFRFLTETEGPPAATYVSLAGLSLAVGVLALHRRSLQAPATD